LVGASAASSSSSLALALRGLPSPATLAHAADAAHDGGRLNQTNRSLPAGTFPSTTQHPSKESPTQEEAPAGEGKEAVDDAGAAAAAAVGRGGCWACL
jgi:hypothetical protein